jgi:5-methylthioadenosine/S-adenosylhomocysteine deaminase
VKRAHVPPLDVIHWATVNGADLAGRAHELGSVEAGKLADLLVVDGDRASTSPCWACRSGCSPS